MQRRLFLASAAATAAAQNPPRRIAAIVTEYRPMSHADVILGKYLEGFNQDERPPYPRSKLVSLFTEQVPDKDMSRERAKKFNVSIYRTVAEALTLGGNQLAVDGVILIGEHGDYPFNDKQQKLYPRFEMFLKIVDVFRQSGRSVPVFNDKHLSWSFRQAKRMVDLSKELKFPMLAGSSVPVAFRKPGIDAPWGEKQRHAVAISYSGLDIYGFHVLEALQSMTERRAGGETGVKGVQCLEGEACWNFLATTPWAQKLFDRALALSETRKPGDLKKIVPSPSVFLVEYADGLLGAAFLLTGAVEDFTVAIDIAGRNEPIATLMKLQDGRPHHHFGCLVEKIEELFVTGRSPYPVERSLLTSGILDFALESRIQGHRKLLTPELQQVRYQTPRTSNFCVSGWGADGKRL